MLPTKGRPSSSPLASQPLASCTFTNPSKAAPPTPDDLTRSWLVDHVTEYVPSHYKSWRLTGLYIACAVLFTAGFIVRVMGAYDYSDVIKFIVTICLVYAAP